MFDIGTPDVAVGAAELADDAQVCNCNGVTKGALVACVARRRRVGHRRDGQDPGRQGLRLVQGAWSCQIVEWAAGGAVTEDPSASLVRARHPLRQADADAARSASCDCTRCPRSSPRSRPTAQEDANSKMGLASLLKMMWGDEYVDERDARFINDRVHANIQRDGTFSVVPQMKGGVTTSASCAGSPTSPRSTTSR